MGRNHYVLLAMTSSCANHLKKIARSGSQEADPLGLDRAYYVCCFTPSHNHNIDSWNASKKGGLDSCLNQGCPTVALLHQRAIGASRRATKQNLVALFNWEISAKHDWLTYQICHLNYFDTNYIQKPVNSIHQHDLLIGLGLNYCNIGWYSSDTRWQYS